MGTHPESGVVAQSHSWFVSIVDESKEVIIWSDIEEGGIYGEPDEDDEFAVELHDGDNIEGWFFENEEPAVDKAEDVMRGHSPMA